MCVKKNILIAKLHTHPIGFWTPNLALHSKLWDEDISYDPGLIGQDVP